MKTLAVVLVLVAFAFARSRPESDPRLKDVRSIFIAGNNKLRKRPAKRCGKTVTKVKPALHSSLTPKMLTPFSRWAQIPRETVRCFTRAIGLSQQR